MENYNDDNMISIQKDDSDSQQERMALLGKLTARIAHELNNPLDGMLRYVNISINQLNNNQPEKVPGYLSQVRDGLNQLSGMVASLLDFSRKDQISEQYTEINKIIEDSIIFLEASAVCNKIIISRDYAKDTKTVRVGNLPGVFSNIIKNAIQASGTNGRVIIKTRTENNNIIIRISDNGPGIPPEYVNDIFKPFFTTKPTGEGTGLGLAICKEIVENRNGTIKAENLKPCGCEFIITIPCV